jgi:hypothetical protein
MNTFRSTRPLILVLLAAMLATAPAAQAADPWHPDVAGTWVFVTAMGPGMTLPGMATFHEDGTVVYTDATMFGASPIPFKVAPFQGVWQMTGKNRFGGTSIGLLFDPATGMVVGFGRARSALRFDGSPSRVVGTLYLEMASCPTPVTCPDPTDPEVTWYPLGDPVNGFPVVLSRVSRVPAGPLQ